MRSQLAGSLKAIIAQRLTAAKEAGRIGLYEVLINTPAVASLIREGKTHQIGGLLQTGMQSGMQTFEQSLRQRERQADRYAVRFSNQLSRIITADSESTLPLVNAL